MSARIHPTGTTIHDPSRSWKGYVLHGAPDGRSHLVDLEGNDVRTWDRVGFPSELIDPALAGGKLGHVLVQLSSTAERGRFNGIFDNRTIGELDWDGKVVWEWGSQAPGGAARQNHDWQRLRNGNTLILATADRVVKVLSDSVVPDQFVREIAPDGTVVWEWSAGDHLEEFGISPEGIDLIRQGVTAGIGGHGFLTLNNLAVVGENRWWDEGDTRFHPENFVIDSREANFVAIVDRKTGSVVWRLGAVYQESGPLSALRILNPAVPRPVDQLAGQHDAHIIPKGLPGAGNLLVFDNQGSSGFPAAALGIFSGSRVLEIDPVKKNIVWQYTAENSDRPVWTFHSSFISSARRLPNGNTLIDEGQNGRIFQVTREGGIVWEYVNPHFGPTLIGLREVSSNWVFRAQPVPYEWVPKGTPRGERAVVPPDISRFRIPVSP
jgi:hypothetical protein